MIRYEDLEIGELYVVLCDDICTQQGSPQVSDIQKNTVILLLKKLEKLDQIHKKDYCIILKILHNNTIKYMYRWFSIKNGPIALRRINEQYP